MLRCRAQNLLWHSLVKLQFKRVATDVATCMYYTGLDPMTKKPVQVANRLHDRRMQRALMQFFKPENYFLVREALLQAGRKDLIGNGCDALIPATPPKEALAKRRNAANADYYHAVPVKKKAKVGATGYRPGRASQGRRER